MLAVDGGQKSGSGTIVRTGVALAALVGKPLRLTQIRARRDPPGLRPQHLKAVQAVRELSRGDVSGATVGSREVDFFPGGALRGGRYEWDIGTAGSTTMLAMTLLPLAAFADGPCTFRISGGLFQDFAPSAFHTQRALLPLLARMGLQAELTVVRPGYVPKGGGVVELRTAPVQGRLRPLGLAKRQGRVRLWGISLSSHLKKRAVSDRMARQCRQALQRRGLDATFQALYDDTALQPGAALALFAQDEGRCILGADRAGAPGRSSEAIGQAVARMLLEDLDTGATVDRYLADQLILFAALAQGTSEYLIPRMTEHIETNLWLAEMILGAKTHQTPGRLRIEGIGYERRR